MDKNQEGAVTICIHPYNSKLQLLNELMNAQWPEIQTHMKPKLQASPLCFCGWEKMD